MRAQAKDLKVGTEYWLDASREVSGVCKEVNVQENLVRFKKVPKQPRRYATDSKGYILFPVDVPYHYKEVEA